jgi:hypothetical protein
MTGGMVSASNSDHYASWLLARLYVDRDGLELRWRKLRKEYGLLFFGVHIEHADRSIHGPVVFWPAFGRFLRLKDHLEDFGYEVHDA